MTKIFHKGEIEESLPAISSELPGPEAESAVAATSWPIRTETLRSNFFSLKLECELQIQEF